MKHYFFHAGVYELASIGFLFSGLTLALLLVFAKRSDRTANLFLSLALTVTVAKVGGLTPLLLPALGPLLFLYIRQLTCPSRQFQRKDVLQFSPLLVAYWMPSWLVLISMLAYLYLAHRLIEDFYKRLKPVLMDRPRFAFRRQETALRLLFLFCTLSLFTDVFYWAIAFAMIGVAVDTIIRPDGIAPMGMPVADRYNVKEKGRRLKVAVAANRLYEDAELTLATLAEQLKIHPHDLSRIINMGLEKNFADFINELRVREIARKMQDPAFDRFTVLGIAHDAGFNSKTTFNRVFKEMTGKTPTEYKNSLEKGVPIHKLVRRPPFQPVILRSDSPSIRAAEKLKRNFMIRNYVRIAWRSLLNNKVSSFINLSGLSIGMAVATLIGLWIYDEVCYNRSYTNYDRIAQVMVHANYDGTINTINSNPLPLAAELRSVYGQNFKQVLVSTGPEQHRIISGEKKFDEIGRYMEPGVTDMLTLKMIYGSRAALKEPNSILLSLSLADKMFGATDPVGKIISIDKKATVKVTGVYADQPGNSEFKNLGFIAPFDLYTVTNEWARKAEDDWSNQFVMIYTELNEHVRFEQVSEKISDSKLSHVSGKQAARKPVVFLQPMSRWHLYNQFENGVNIRSEALKYVWFYGIIGVFVLLLACINFMNLSTARSEKRAKEVGIRKVAGSGRTQLIVQFYTESVLLAFFGFLFALGLVALSLPWFNNLASKSMHIPLANPFFWLSGLSFALFTGLLAGSYPALYLSSFKPIKVLKGNFRIGALAAVPRQALVILQFTVSIALVIGTIVVYRQIRFAQDRPVGYSRNGLVSINLAGDMQAKYDVLYSELKTSDAITNMAESSSPLTSIWSTSIDVDWPGKSPDSREEFSTISVSSGYGKTVGWHFSSGRDFNAGMAGDSSALVVNESAARAMGLRDSLNTMIKYEGKDYRIIGVASDMVMESPFNPASPTLFFLRGDRNCLFLKLNPALGVQVALARALDVFKRVTPDAPVDVKFVDEAYAAKFAAEVRVGSLSGSFAGLAILISCLGLFGMASFMAEQRIKEIGIRKILGASVLNLWYSQALSFVKLVLSAFLVAASLAGYFMYGWLNNYQYHIALSWWIFAVAGGGALCLTLLTVSYQAIKTALTSPVKSLRSE